MASYDGGRFPPYVSVAQRKRQAYAAVEALKKRGEVVSPVEVVGKKIATTFWGIAWCSALEGYGEYASRLERGRTYVRQGAVIDLKIDKGRVLALVSGSSVYRVEVTFDTLKSGVWEGIKAACAGQIGTLMELLTGALSAGVMEVVTKKRTGLFPSSHELHFRCSCPDYAMMCKHVAAVLYGVGARFDTAPTLMFTLRGVDPNELVDAAMDQHQPMAAARTPKGRRLAEGALSSVFGVDVDLDFDGTASLVPTRPSRAATAVNSPATKPGRALRAPVNAHEEPPPGEKSAEGVAPVTRPRRATKAATPILKYPACAVVAVYPPEDPEVVALVDVGLHKVASFHGEGLERLRASLVAYDVIAAVDVASVVRALGLDESTWRLVDLGAPVRPPGMVAAVRISYTTERVVASTCGVTTGLGDLATMQMHHRRGDIAKVKRRLETDAKNLSAVFSFGCLHGAVRFVGAKLDARVPVTWADAGGPGLAELKAFALAQGVGLELVVATPVPWRDPWASACVAYVRCEPGGKVGSLYSEDGVLIADSVVQRARLAQL